MTLDCSVEFRQALVTGNFCKINVGSIARLWFVDSASTEEKPNIVAIYSEITSEELRGFDICVSTNDSTHYYESVSGVTPHFFGTSEELKEFTCKIEVVSCICDAIECFFEARYLKLRNKEQV